MSAAFDREALLDAFDRIGRAAVDAPKYALAGAIAEYLAKQRRLGLVPHWVCDPARRLERPWFTATNPSDAMREYLTYSSPGEFASRNIFTEERPLRRARGPHPSDR